MKKNRCCEVQVLVLGLKKIVCVVQSICLCFLKKKIVVQVFVCVLFKVFENVFVQKLNTW